MADLVHVKGLSEIERFLDELTEKLKRDAIRGGLRAGAVVLRDAAKALVPVGPPSAENILEHGGYQGALRDSLRVSTRVGGNKVTARVSAGGTKKNGADTYYALWVEFGTRPHVIAPLNGGALMIGGRVVAHVMHPGARPRPFMRPALDGAAQAAVLAVAEHIKARLSTKHGLDTADIQVEAS